MGCLTDVDVQAVVDDEASEEHRAHVTSCERCRTRVDERRRQMGTVSSLIETEGVPSAHFEAGMRRAMTSGGEARGSTVLRAAPRSPWRKVGWVSALATAAVIAVIVFGLLPQLGAPTTLSAKEILGRSLQTMTNGHGVEVLQYEVQMEGMADGPILIRQIIDRDNPNRYKIESFAPGNRLISAISQDPITQRRAQLIQVDGTNYVVRVGAIRNPVLSLPQMAQALVETSIGLMQAKSDQQLTVEDGPAGKRYVIDVPPVTPTNPAATLDIFGARAIISAQDFRILEFQATGTLLKQPFSVSVNLLTQDYIGGEAPSFAIEPAPGDVVLEGEAGDDPVTELLTTVLRELGRARGR
jgi:hypothetical protein